MEDSSRSICVPPPLSSPNPKEGKNVVVILDPQVVFPPPYSGSERKNGRSSCCNRFAGKKREIFLFLGNNGQQPSPLPPWEWEKPSLGIEFHLLPERGEGGREALVCPPAAACTFEPGSFSHLDFPSLSFLPCNALLLI